MKRNQYHYTFWLKPIVRITIPKVFLTCHLSQVTLKGAKNCVDAARDKINTLVEDLESQVTIECIIEQQHHR